MVRVPDGVPSVSAAMAGAAKYVAADRAAATAKDVKRICRLLKFPQQNLRGIGVYCTEITPEPVIRFT
ncbi:hypothetical protein AAJCM20276_07630 [Acetobacter aceti]|uniref:Uncharacterized protein n=1 Tax=Acetobacter aceti TaxID=435 RepID=A0A6S6PFS8_ACEAC|nr:hypothetical protein AAJCM20276_07630 [Acetobacter aceti]